MDFLIIEDESEKIILGRGWSTVQWHAQKNINHSLVGEIEYIPKVGQEAKKLIYDKLKTHLNMILATKDFFFNC